MLDQDLAPRWEEDGDEVRIRFHVRAESEWRQARTRLADSALLGAARVSGARFEDTDGRPLRIGRDYFGNRRNTRPLPGPFEKLQPLPMRVWPPEPAAPGKPE